METLGLLFTYFPLWAQVVILIVLLLPALIQAVEALVRALVPRRRPLSRPRPFYHDRDFQRQQVLRQQLRRKRNAAP